MKSNLSNAASNILLYKLLYKQKKSPFGSFDFDTKMTKVIKIQPEAWHHFLKPNMLRVQAQKYYATD